MGLPCSVHAPASIGNRHIDTLATQSLACFVTSLGSGGGRILWGLSCLVLRRKGKEESKLSGVFWHRTEYYVDAGAEG